MLKSTLFQGMSKPGKILFILSLALNLAVIGSLVGHRLWHGRGHPHGMQHHILKLIPEAKKDAVEKVLNSFQKNHPRKRPFIENWNKYETLLRAEEFNREAFLQTFQSEITNRTERLSAGGKAIADIAEILSHEERIEVLNKLKQKWHRHKRMHHRHHH